MEWNMIEKGGEKRRDLIWRFACLRDRNRGRNPAKRGSRRDPQVN